MLNYKCPNKCVVYRFYGFICDFLELPIVKVCKNGQVGLETHQTYDPAIMVQCSSQLKPSSQLGAGHFVVYLTAMVFLLIKSLFCSLRRNPPEV